MRNTLAGAQTPRIGILEWAMEWVGGALAWLGIAWTLLLVYRWAAQAADWRWRTALRAAVTISLPMGLGLALCLLVVFSALGGVEPTAWVFLLAGSLVLAFLMTALVYLPYARWASRHWASKTPPG